jgi:hypothetical protein
MADENEASEKKRCNNKHVNANSSSGAVYGMAFIGAAVYFIQHSATFWMGALGILKALVWPAILVYKLLEYLKM